MLFQRVNRSDPEKVFVVVYNSYSTASLTNGQAVTWDFITDYNGVSVTIPLARATNGGFAFAGIVAETIAAGSYGLIQVYGYHSATRCRAKTSSAPGIHAGRPLALNSAGSLFCLESFATGSTVIQVAPCAISLGSNVLWTTSAIAVFIKAM
jgi:hypothetical protein